MGARACRTFHQIARDGAGLPEAVQDGIGCFFLIAILPSLASRMSSMTWNARPICSQYFVNAGEIASAPRRDRRRSRRRHR